MAKTSNAEYSRMVTGKSENLSFSSLKSPTKKSTGGSGKPVGTLREELKVLIEMNEEDSLSILQVKRNMFSWFSNSLTLYDKRTVFLIAVNFFSEGAMFMICLLSTLMFRDVFLMEPEYATLHLAAICLPEGLIFFFSIIFTATLKPVSV